MSKTEKYKSPAVSFDEGNLVMEWLYSEKCPLVKVKKLQSKSESPFNVI